MAAASTSRDPTGHSAANPQPETAHIRLGDWILDPKNFLYAAWPASWRVREILDLIGKHEAVPVAMAPLQPKFHNDKERGDPVKAFVMKTFSPEHACVRTVLSVADVTPDVEGAHRLLDAGCYNAVIDLSREFLLARGHGDPTGLKVEFTLEIMQMWHCRFLSMYYSRDYEALFDELESFSDFNAAELYFDNYPQVFGQLQGCMVPFSLRLLHAVCAFHVNKQQLALDRLYQLYYVCKPVLAKLPDLDGHVLSDEDANLALILWTHRAKIIVMTFANLCMKMQDYDMAVTVVKEHIMYKQRIDAKMTSDTFPTDTEAAPDAKMLSFLGRIYLSFGDTHSAQECFDRVVNSSPHLESQIAMNNALIAVASARFPLAAELLDLVIAKEPENIIAHNNKAVCQLYSGQMDRSLNTLETFVGSHPHIGITEPVCSNLASMFELESSRAVARKQALLLKIANICGDGFDVGVLRLPA